MAKNPKIELPLRNDFGILCDPKIVPNTNLDTVCFTLPGSDMLWACITFFIFMPVLTIGGHFLDDLAFEVFGAVLLIVSSVSVFMTDRLFGKIYPPSRRKAVMQHYAGRKFSPFRRNLFFFPLYLLLIPAMVLLGTALKWITEILK